MQLWTTEAMSGKNMEEWGGPWRAYRNCFEAPSLLECGYTSLQLLSVAGIVGLPSSLSQEACCYLSIREASVCVCARVPLYICKFEKWVHQDQGSLPSGNSQFVDRDSSTALNHCLQMTSRNGRTISWRGLQTENAAAFKALGSKSYLNWGADWRMCSYGSPEKQRHV